MPDYVPPPIPAAEMQALQDMALVLGDMPRDQKIALLVKVYRLGFTEGAISALAEIRFI